MRDRIKPSAAEAVAILRRRGLRTVLLTGDSEATARAVAAEICIDEVLAGVLPAERRARSTGWAKAVRGWRWSLTASRTAPRWRARIWAWPSRGAATSPCAPRT
ncbi:HAD family hydrolase [Prauserella endophytica]|nr:HAD family hydrolase [Prauserella endophytica]